MEALGKSLTVFLEILNKTPEMFTASFFKASIFSLCLNSFNFGEAAVLDNFPKLNCEKMRRESNEVNKRLIKFFQEETRDRQKLKKEDYNKKYTARYLQEMFSMIAVGTTQVKHNQFFGVVAGTVFSSDY